MESNERRMELLDAAMQIVAECGLNGFSMKKVTQRVGVSEALIYRYFPSKDNLLFSCFESVNKHIAALFDKLSPFALDTPQAVEASARSLWLLYFEFLVKARHRTIFYFDYRDSAYIKQIKATQDEMGHTYFRSFVGLMDIFNGMFDVYAQVDADYVWTYILDTTGIFAKRVIRGELPDTKESHVSIWKLIFGGIAGLLSA